MTKPVVTTPEADRHIRELDRWWRENREKSPDLFTEELAAAFEAIGSAPNAGKRYRHALKDVRRFLMRSTRNHVYYVELEQQVLVLAVWGAIKERGPML